MTGILGKIFKKPVSELGIWQTHERRVPLLTFVGIAPIRGARGAGRPFEAVLELNNIL